MNQISLRFCPSCLASREAAEGAICTACRVEMWAMLDADGAIARTFLAARGSCCDSGCRNCPYKDATPALEGAIKSCENCGAPFECVGKGCWCAAVELTSERRCAINSQFSDCLCPECLAALQGVGGKTDNTGR